MTYWNVYAMKCLSYEQRLLCVQIIHAPTQCYLYHFWYSSNHIRILMPSSSSDEMYKRGMIFLMCHKITSTAHGIHKLLSICVQNDLQIPWEPHHLSSPHPLCHGWMDKWMDGWSVSKFNIPKLNNLHNTGQIQVKDVQKYFTLT